MGQVEIAPSRLLHGAERLFGREQELAALDEAWSKPSTHILTIVAWGGVGKTSLVVEWMARQAAAGWPGFERVFDWSFYSQGSREPSAASADTFIAAALEFFGDATLARSAASPWDKGARLAQLVGQKRSLLMLDGLEPLQHPPGPLTGQLKDPALTALLRGLALRNPGLCLVTTRERVADVAPFRDTTAPVLDLRHLSTPAGVELLKTLGVRGNETEFHRLVEEVKGHALTLNLLGRYLAKAHRGDIRRRDQVKFHNADAKVQGGHAFRVMEAYETWLASGGEDGARQLTVLRLLGLFDRPADAGCIAALRSEPVIPGLTEPLIGLAEDDWNLTLSALADSNLVAVQPPSAHEISASSPRPSLDAHPLIREYFAQQLREKHPDAWKAAHRRLYEYLRRSAPDKSRPTLEDLQPLYQAVAHACRANLHQEALVNVYHARILRDSEYYTAKKLGAISSNLGAVASFFDQPWSRLSPMLTAASQAWLSGEAAFCLHALGRQTEGLEPMRASLEQFVSQERWRDAAITASNLSELILTLGDVAGALREADTTITYADRSGDWEVRMPTRATLANALHQAGRSGEATARFREAENLQANRQPRYPLLYSARGFHYCDLLLAAPERAAWRALRSLGSAGRSSELAVVCRTVGRRAGETLKWAASKLDPLDEALDHLTLARAALCRAVLEHARTQKPRAELTKAMDGLRRAGQQQYVVCGLLSRAWSFVLQSDRSSARADLDEAWQIAERGPMRLHLADIHLHRARLFFREKPYPWTSPRADLAAARQLIERCGYWRRREELEDAEEAIRG